jgi:putative ABC transport system ATP-binding protein
MLLAQNLEISLADGDRHFCLTVDRLELSRSAVVALTGPSGAGKTLLLELLGLLRPPSRGSYVVGDTDLSRLWARGARGAALAQARGRVFGFVPQTGGLLPFLTVAENVALPQRVTGQRDPSRVAYLLDRLGIAAVRHLRPGALSIGQRQRTAIARALSHRPPFIIADEPTASLDPDAADTALGLLLEAVQDEGTGLILSSHDLPRMAHFGIPQARLEVVAQGQGVISRLESRQC